MPIYIRFENNKQIEVTELESKPKGNDWYEAPKNFDWQKSYCLTEGGKIVERSKEDIELELLETAKLSALDSVRFIIITILTNTQELLIRSLSRMKYKRKPQRTF